MKRIACLMLLTALSSPAYARDSYSFVVGGHRIDIEAGPHCRSLSCVSISIPGVGHWRHGHRDSDEITTVDNPAPAPAPAPAQQPPPPAQPPARSVSAPPVAPAPPLTRAQIIPPAAQVQPAAQPAVLPASQPVPAAARPSPVQAQPSPPPAPKLAAAPSAPPAVGFETPKPQPSAVAAAPTVTPQGQPKPQTSSTAIKPEAKPQDKVSNKQDNAVPGRAAPRVNPPVARVSQQNEGNTAATPIGDWQTQGTGGAVRIEACGHALCGYMLDVTTGAKGETILVNMKPKSGADKRDSRWSGNVYSRSSGNSYYGTMTLKEPNTLRVEACAFGSFFCSGNNWTRLEHSRSARPDRDVAISRRDAQQPRS